MKSLLLLILLSSCYILPDLPDWEIPESFSTLEEALDYVKSIEYRDDSADDWNTPEETYKRGWGDCSDLSLLLAHIAVVKLKIDNTEIIWGNYENKFHSWVSINNKWYEPQWGIEIDDYSLFVMTRRFDYESALRTADGDC